MRGARRCPVVAGAAHPEPSPTGQSTVVPTLRAGTPRAGVRERLDLLLGRLAKVPLCVWPSLLECRGELRAWHVVTFEGSPRLCATRIGLGLHAICDTHGRTPGMGHCYPAQGYPAVP
eukprot:420197-Prymnesium_polylepis.1